MTSPLPSKFMYRSIAIIVTKAMYAKIISLSFILFPFVLR